MSKTQPVPVVRADCASSQLTPSTNGNLVVGTVFSISHPELACNRAGRDYGRAARRWRSQAVQEVFVRRPRGKDDSQTRTVFDVGNDDEIVHDDNDRPRSTCTDFLLLARLCSANSLWAVIDLRFWPLPLRPNYVPLSANPKSDVLSVIILHVSGSADRHWA